MPSNTPHTLDRINHSLLQTLGAICHSSRCYGRISSNQDNHGQTPALNSHTPDPVLPARSTCCRGKTAVSENGCEKL